LTQDEVFTTLDQLKQQGKIRRWGASVESTAEALHCLQQPGCSSLQVIFNLFRQTPSLQLFERCLQQNVSVIVRLPLASGLLAGRYTPETTFAPTDHRSYNRNGEKFNVGETFAGVGFETGLKLVEALRPMVPPGQTLAEFALAFCLSFPAVSTIIPGARNADQARRNAAASDRPKLPAETLARLRQFYQEQVAPLVRGPD
jgi:aryl-alcohol dehydrogenase-like predicted oxidoreductase